MEQSLDIYKQISKVMKELPAIGKNQQSLGGKFNYAFRSIDDYLNACQPVLAKHDVSISSEIISHDQKGILSERGAKGLHTVVHYKFRFSVSKDSFIETQAIGESMDYGDKGYNKCHSIALKYALNVVLMIPTQDAYDPDFTQHEVKQEKEIKNNVEPINKSNGTYVCNFGKFNGKTMKEVGYEQALNYLNFLNQSQKPSKNRDSFAAAFDDEFKKTSNPTFDQNEQLPF